MAKFPDALARRAAAAIVRPRLSKGSSDDRQFRTDRQDVRLRRRPQRGFHDEESVFRVLDAAVIGHIGYAIDGDPFVTPTAYWRDGRRLYWHGSAQSRMIQVQSAGIAACLAVSILDGLIVARSSFHNSIQYRSVMAFGRTEPVEGREAKRHAMDAFVARLYPGRPREVRAMHDSEIDAIGVIGMEIAEASAKIRTGGVEDEAEDYALPCWAGVVPIRTVVGNAEPDARLLVDPGAPGEPRALRRERVARRGAAACGARG